MSFTPDQQAEWHEWRRAGIGASDSPAILGVSQHATRLAVYLDKIGASKPRKQTEAQEWGLLLEPLILQVYSRRTDVGIVAQQDCVVSTAYPWMRATLDARGDDGRIIEFKALGLHAANGFQAGPGEWSKLPESWIVQGNHQMVVAEQEWMDFAVFLPLELRIFSVQRNDRLCRVIIDWTRKFWGLVENRIPPKTVDPRDHDKLQLAYPNAEGSIVLADASLVNAAMDYRNSKDKAAKVAILDAMGDAETATLANGWTAKRTMKYKASYVVAESKTIKLEIFPPEAPHVDEEI